jgi:hypothetical protein
MNTIAHALGIIAFVLAILKCYDIMSWSFLKFWRPNVQNKSLKNLVSYWTITIVFAVVEVVFLLLAVFFAFAVGYAILQTH